MALFAKWPVLATLSMCAVAWASGAQPGDEPGIKFELRLAETDPAKGLTEATVEGTQRKVYLHKEAGLSNDDVAMAQATTTGGSTPAIDVR